MIDIKLLRSNPGYVKRRLATRGFNLDVEQFSKLDSRVRSLTNQVQEGQAEHKRKSAGKLNDLELGAVRDFKNRISQLGEVLAVAKSELNAFMIAIPNIPYQEPSDALVECVLAELEEVADLRDAERDLQRRITEYLDSPIDDPVEWTETLLRMVEESKRINTPYTDLLTEAVL